MYISELLVSNFKSFGNNIAPLEFGLPSGKPGSGLNIFVGENNTGKSTIFEAIDFLRNGTKKDPLDINNKDNDEQAQVDVTFSGNLEEVVEGFSQPNKKSVFRKYIYADAMGKECLKISRDSADLKQIKLWDSTADTYSNETGIDAPLRKLFEANFVWANTNPNDEAAFGASTVCGSLLKEVATEFTKTDDYLEFTSKFNEVFNSDASELRVRLNEIESRVKNVFSTQFGEADISFHFDELKVDSFFKNSIIKIDDGIETSMHEKGNGMQRALALSLLQVYAEEIVKHPDNDAIKKPFFLFIDEPEICLHPKGQERLLNALLEISRTKQVFIATHSPYFLASKNLRNVTLHIFQKNGNFSVVEKPTDSPYFPWSPTWGEINFKAYKLATVDLHNELYGYLQQISEKNRLNQFEDWLNEAGAPKTKQWTKEGVVNKSSEVSLHTFIRNKIHHPENIVMQGVDYTSDELNSSINQMVQILRDVELSKII